MEDNKIKTIAIVLVLILIFSSIVAYIYLGEFEDDAQTCTILQDDSAEEVLDPTTEKVNELISKLDESMIQGYIEKLVSWGPHPTATRIPYILSNRKIIGQFFDLPIEKVGRYIYKEFESMGLDVEYQYWEEEPKLKNLKAPPQYHPIQYFGWHLGNNIVATLTGTDSSSDEIYVLVAHYDTVIGAPGANDDSSGVAAILAAAKLMSQYSFNHTVVFLAVDGEEQGLYGSGKYVEEAAKNNDNIVATLGIDMIGNRGPEYRDPEVLLIQTRDSSWITNFIINVNQRYPECLNFTILTDEIVADGSPGFAKGHFGDYLRFLLQGYDAVHIVEGVDDTDWHQPSDTLENMDVTYSTKVSKLILATIADMAWDVDI
jgi:hypothetical protein